MIKVSPQLPTPGCRRAQLPMHNEPLWHSSWHSLLAPLSPRNVGGAKETGPKGLDQGARVLCPQGQPCSLITSLPGQVTVMVTMGVCAELYSL